ncbi:hypothetical protein JCM10213_005993 [Rhodosporidiobolus nylandii]
MNPPPKRVSFCPLALLIGVAGDGEIEEAMQEAQRQQLGRRKVAVRTYSIEAPNLGEVAGKAWHSVVNGFSASLDPFLNSGRTAHGVYSSSRGRDSSPERERESSLSRSRSRSRSPSPGGRGRSLSPAVEMEEDPTFIPNAPTRLKLKLPMLKRECSMPCGSSASKPILRRPSLSYTSPSTSPSSPTIELPVFAPLDNVFSTSPANSAPHLFPTLSRATSHPSCSAAHPEAGLIVPLASCCPQCEAAAMYGCQAADEGEGAYEERWSLGAQKLREEQRKEREERERWQSAASEIAKKYQLGEEERDEGAAEKEAEAAEEEARGSRLARLAREGGVDELGSAVRRHSVSSTSSSAGEHDMQGVEAVGVVEPLTQGGHSEKSLLATVIAQEPATIESDTAFPMPLSPAPASSAAAVLPAPQPSHPAPPAQLPTSALAVPPSAPAAPPRPPKRRLSSATAASSTSPSRAPVSPSSEKTTLSQRIAAMGSSLLQGTSSGMGSPGLRAGM